MSEMSEKDMEGFLSQPLIARLATVGDGEPYVAPMWFLYEDGVIVMSTGRDSKKVENIRQNPKVAVAIDTTQGGFAFQGVIVRGRAELQEGGDKGNLGEDYGEVRRPRASPGRETSESTQGNYKGGAPEAHNLRL